MTKSRQENIKEVHYKLLKCLYCSSGKTTRTTGLYKVYYNSKGIMLKCRRCGTKYVLPYKHFDKQLIPMK